MTNRSFFKWQEQLVGQRNGTSLPARLADRCLGLSELFATNLANSNGFNCSRFIRFAAYANAINRPGDDDERQQPPLARLLNFIG